MFAYGGNPDWLSSQPARILREPRGTSREVGHRDFQSQRVGHLAIVVGGTVVKRIGDELTLRFDDVQA
jgi:hypothetical protein